MERKVSETERKGNMEGSAAIAGEMRKEKALSEDGETDVPHRQGFWIASMLCSVISKWPPMADKSLVSRFSRRSREFKPAPAPPARPSVLVSQERLHAAFSGASFGLGSQVIALLEFRVCVSASCEDARFVELLSE